MDYKTTRTTYSIREIKRKIEPIEDGCSAREIMSERLFFSSREISRCKQFEDGVMVKRAYETAYSPIWLKDILRAGDILNIKIYEDMDNSGDVIPSDEEIDIVYGGDYRKYYNETVALLEANGNKIMKSRYAKSITAWIYPCEDLVTNNDIAEQSAMDKIGRRIPSYHLIDVWKLLKTEYGDVDIPEEQPVEIHPINTRCPLSQIKNLHDWDAGFDAGFKYWEKGDAERKAGNIEKAIELFDKARYNGYFAPALYTSYAMAYRKLKDLDNEIAILDEAIERYQGEERDSSQNIIDCEKQKAKAIEKLKKQRK